MYAGLPRPCVADVEDLKAQLRGEIMDGRWRRRRRKIQTKNRLICSLPNPSVNVNKAAYLIDTNSSNLSQLAKLIIGKFKTRLQAFINKVFKSRWIYAFLADNKANKSPPLIYAIDRDLRRRSFSFFK